MDKMAASKLEENKNIARMADFDYRLAYLRNWIQLSNSGVPHELLANVLPPLYLRVLHCHMQLYQVTLDAIPTFLNPRGNIRRRKNA
jgi:hypothetical protein